MKNIARINNVAFGICILLSITIYLTIIALPILGLIQIISALLITIKIKEKTKDLKTNISIYWVLALSNLLLMHLNSDMLFNNDYSLYIFIIIPIAIAIYFLYICNTLIKL